MRVSTPIIYAILVVLLFFNLPLFADEGLQVVDVEVNSDQGQPALVVNFNQSIRYRGITPDRPAREFDIQLLKQLPIVQGNDKLDSRSERIRVPNSELIALQKLELITDGSDVRLSIRFSKVVNLRVGQFSGSNSITIIQMKNSLSEDDMSLMVSGENREESMMNAGRRALRLGDHALAIRIFKALMSMPDNPHSRDALELLGLARERNNQLAQAKLIYSQYLSKYKKNDDARVRVKQRLAELLVVKQQPKEKLKKSGVKKIHQTLSLLNISQFYYRGTTSTSGQTSVDDQSQLNSRLSYQWRKRSAKREIKHFMYANNIYDFQSKDGTGFVSSPNDRILINTAYSRIKDREKNYAASVGRQTGQGGGVLGRYDGVDLSYGLASKIKVGINLGSPVKIGDKDRIQREKKFISTRLDFDDFVKDWNFSTYAFSQTQEGFTDRRSVGGEIRYFSEGLSLFNQIDYDVYFSEMTVYLLRMQYKMPSGDTFIFNVDSRRLVETSNALIGTTSESLQPLADANSDDQLKTLALNNTPKSNYTTLGWNHSFTNLWDANIEYSRGTEILNDAALTPDESRYDFQFLNLLLTKGDFAAKNDLLFLNTRFSKTDSYNETLAWVSYRQVFSKYRVLSKLKMSRRDSNGDIKNSLKPSLKLNYRFAKDSDLEFEIGVEKVKYGGSAIEEDYTYTHFNLGYDYFF